MSPEHKTKQTNSPSTTSITSFIQEIGFKQDSPEFIACIKLLETIKSKKHDSENVKIVDLTSAVEIPKNNTVDKVNEEINTTEEHEKIFEEEDD